jgi:ADP-ribosyl-[dinitrogen reductase] hydrolase
VDARIRDRIRGCAVGAAIGDALGMPLEFRPASPENRLVVDILSGRLPAGSFTDDTEMALALAESLLVTKPLDGEVLATHFVEWYQSSPADMGIHTSQALSMLARGTGWEATTRWIEETLPDKAGNGALMRCWPVALSWWDQRGHLVEDSILQTRITHPHPDCMAASVFVNVMISELVQGADLPQAYHTALKEVKLPEALYRIMVQASERKRRDLPNSGWVRHTMQSAIWGVMTTTSFEQALIQVINLGADADTTGAVTGAIAGAAYGLQEIPVRWRDELHGEWLRGSGNFWHSVDFISLADRLSG